MTAIKQCEGFVLGLRQLYESAGHRAEFMGRFHGELADFELQLEQEVQRERETLLSRLKIEICDKRAATLEVHQKRMTQNGGSVDEEDAENFNAATSPEATDEQDAQVLASKMSEFDSKSSKVSRQYVALTRQLTESHFTLVFPITDLNNTTCYGLCHHNFVGTPASSGTSPEAA